MRWQPSPVAQQAGELQDDIRVVMDSAEDLVKATADVGGEKLRDLRARVDEALKAVQTKMSAAHERVRDKTRAEVDAANTYVHENPWKAVGVAAGVGLLIGLLVSARRA